MRDIAGVREHDQQHAAETDHEPRRAQRRDRLAERESRDQRDEEWRGVQKDCGDGRTGAGGPDADPDLRERGIAEPDRGRPRATGGACAAGGCA